MQYNQQIARRYPPPIIPLWFTPITQCLEELQLERVEKEYVTKDGSAKYQGHIPYNTIYAWAVNNNIESANEFTSLVTTLEKKRIDLNFKDLDQLIKKEAKKNVNRNRNRR